MRLALELTEVGFTVEAACPRGYQVEKMPFVKASYRYNALAPVSALRDIIMMSRPTLLVPCDDYVTRQLHEIYRTARPNEPGGYWLRTLIVRSLGDPEHFSLLYSRYGIGSLARELNIPAPPTVAVTADYLSGMSGHCRLSGGAEVGRQLVWQGSCVVTVLKKLNGPFADFLHLPVFF